MWRAGAGFNPDMLIEPVKCPEGALASAPRVVDSMKKLPCGLADMEGAALYETAQIFFEQHELLFFKIVYDHPDDARAPQVDMKKRAELIRARSAQVQQLCAQYAPALCEGLCAAEKASRRAYAGREQIFSREEQLAEEAFARDIKATAAMRHQLHQILYYKKLLGTDAAVFLRDAKQHYGLEPCTSKKEGMQQLRLLKEVL